MMNEKLKCCIYEVVILLQYEIMQNARNADFEPSKKFQKRISRISKSCNKPFFAVAHRPVRRTVAITFAVVILAVVMTCTVQAVRKSPLNK